MNNKILLVDDDMDILLAYQRNLRKHFFVSIANSGKEGLEMFVEEGPFAVVMSDFSMPYMNGVEFLAHIRSLNPDTVRIMITGYADLQIAVNAVNEGKVFRFLTKPIGADQLIPVLCESVDQYKLVVSERELLDKTLKGSIKIMIDILSSVNPVAFSRASRIRGLSRHIAERLGMKNLWEVEIAALLSQIGAISVPQEIFDKQLRGEELTEIESEMINNINVFSAELVKNIPRLDGVAAGIKKQNYNFIKAPNSDADVSGNNIPAISRILRIVCDFDSMLQTKIVYREVINKMLQQTKKYDQSILKILDEIISGETSSKQKKAISLKQLRITMTLAEDMRDENGTMLLSKGREVTDVVLMKLINVTKVRKIMEPIYVLE